MSKRKGKCPHCNCSLIEEGIGMSEPGEMLWKVYVDGGELGFEQDEFDGQGETELYCRGCGKKLVLTDIEIIKILGQGN